MQEMMRLDKFKPSKLQQIILEILLENHDAGIVMTEDEVVNESLKRQARIEQLKDQK